MGGGGLVGVVVLWGGWVGDGVCGALVRDVVVVDEGWVVTDAP